MTFEISGSTPCCTTNSYEELRTKNQDWPLVGGRLGRQTRSAPCERGKCAPCEACRKSEAAHTQTRTSSPTRDACDNSSFGPCQRNPRTGDGSSHGTGGGSEEFFDCFARMPVD